LACRRALDRAGLHNAARIGHPQPFRFERARSIEVRDRAGVADLPARVFCQVDYAAIGSSARSSIQRIAGRHLRGSREGCDKGSND